MSDDDLDDFFAKKDKSKSKSKKSKKQQGVETTKLKKETFKIKSEHKKKLKETENTEPKLLAVESIAKVSSFFKL